MTTEDVCGLFSALLGMAGTVLIFFNSYTMQPMDGGIFGSEELNNHNSKIRAKNALRLKLQRVGLFLLCASFIAQAISILI